MKSISNRTLSCHNGQEQKFHPALLFANFAVAEVSAPVMHLQCFNRSTQKGIILGAKGLFTAQEFARNCDYGQRPGKLPGTADLFGPAHGATGCGHQLKLILLTAGF